MFGQVIPFGFVVVTWIAFLFGVFNGISYMSFTMLGAAVGTMIAVFANVVPFGFLILVWQGYFLITILRSSKEFLSKSVRVMFLPIILIVIGGLLFNSFSAFQVDQGHGLGVGWMGCSQTFQTFSACAPSPFTIIPLSFFAPLIKGDIVGFFVNLFQVQTAIPLISIATGAMLLLIGLGIGGSISVIGSGFQWSISDSGTRMAQSLGIGAIIYGTVGIFFGTWYAIISPDWGVGILLQILLTTLFFYGAYLQGKTVVE